MELKQIIRHLISRATEIADTLKIDIDNISEKEKAYLRKELITISRMLSSIKR
jgi:hypothetical protein